jgi:hypothetical protein
MAKKAKPAQKAKPATKAQARLIRSALGAFFPASIVGGAQATRQAAALRPRAFVPPRSKGRKR